MAVLELVKEQLVELVQNEAFAPIHVRARSEVQEGAAPVEEVLEEGDEDVFEPREEVPADLTSRTATSTRSPRPAASRTKSRCDPTALPWRRALSSFPACTATL